MKKPKPKPKPKPKNPKPRMTRLPDRPFFARPSCQGLPTVDELKIFSSRLHGLNTRLAQVADLLQDLYNDASDLSGICQNNFDDGSGFVAFEAYHERERFAVIRQLLEQLRVTAINCEETVGTILRTIGSRSGDLTQFARMRREGLPTPYPPPKPKEP